MYEEHLTKKSIFFSWQTWLLLAFYFVIRIASYFLVRHEIIQAVLVFLLLMTLGILYFKKPIYGWYLLLAELFLGGSGHYLEFLGLSIRTLFIGFFLFLWLANHLGQSVLKKRLALDKEFGYLFILLFIFLIFGVGNGLYQGNSLHQVIADFVPFILLFLVFPSFQLFQEEETQEFLVRLLAVFLVGTAIFSLFSFTLFTNLWAVPQGAFQVWYETVNSGRIFYLSNGFFRLLEPEHLLIVPLVLIITSLLMRAEKHNKMWRLMRLLGLIILVLNLSPGYFLALAVGLIFLKYKHSWKKWLRETVSVVALVAIIFVGLNFIVSGGNSLGADVGVGVVSESQMAVLPGIWKIVISHPLLGQGLGSSVTFYNPQTYENVTTANFEWGYLEMWAKLGLLGAIVLVAFYIFIIQRLVKKIKAIPDWHDFDVGLLGSVAAFLIMNITIPTLFHVYTALFIALLAALVLKNTQGFNRTVNVLYQVFNKLKV